MELLEFTASKDGSWYKKEMILQTHSQDKVTENDSLHFKGELENNYFKTVWSTNPQAFVVNKKKQNWVRFSNYQLNPIANKSELRKIALY